MVRGPSGQLAECRVIIIIIIIIIIAHQHKACRQLKIKQEIIIIIFFDPGTQFPRNEKITLCNIIIIIILYPR